MKSISTYTESTDQNVMFISWHRPFKNFFIPGKDEDGQEVSQEAEAAQAHHRHRDYLRELNNNKIDFTNKIATDFEYENLEYYADIFEFTNVKCTVITVTISRRDNRNQSPIYNF